MENISVLGQVAQIVGKSAASTVAKTTSDLLSLKKSSIFKKNEEDALNFEPLLQPDKDNLDDENIYEESRTIHVSPLYGATDSYDKVITQAEYERLADQFKYSTLANRGDTMAARDMWKEPRRFRAHLQKISIKNISSTSYSSVFLLISIGGNQTQVQVATLPQEKPSAKLLGYSGKRFFSEALPLLETSTTQFPFEEECEWRGSYLHLEKENFTIELWESCGFALNKLLGIYQEPLRNIVNTSVDRSATLESLCNATTDYLSGESSFHILYQFEFEEIYDYELNFRKIQIFSLQHVNTESFMNEPTKTPHTCTSDSNQQSDEIQKLWQNFQGTPVLTLSIKPSGYNKWPILVSAPLKYSKNINFNKPLLFRGTSANLENVNVDISLTDSGLSTCFLKPKYTGIIRLRDIWTSENLSFQLLADKKVVFEGSITCSIPFKPKYRQTGRICDIEEDQTYLFLKLIKIDHLYVQGENENIDSFIEVTYNGMNKYSTTVYQSSEPHYQSELIFQTSLPDFETPSNLNAQFLDPILFDVWRISVIGCQHEGCVELHLSELENASSQEQTKYYFNRRQNKENSYSANIFSFAKYLIHPGKTGSSESESILHFELWTMPDLKKAQWYPMLKLYKPSQNMYLEAGCVPSNLQKDLRDHLSNWEATFENYSTLYYDMRCLALDQRKRLLPYNFFVYPIILPSAQIMTPFACFNFVRTIWYREDSYFPSSYYQWSLPDFILKSKQGKAMYHALLLTSLFLGLEMDAFVCIGTPHHEDEEYAWVLTNETILFDNTKEKCLRIWDPLSMTVYILRHNVNLPSSIKKKSIQEGLSCTLSAIPEVTNFDANVLSKTIDKTIRSNTKSETECLDPDGDYPFTLEEMHCSYGVSNRGSYKHPAGKTTFSTKLIQINKDFLPFRSIRVVFNKKNVYGFLGSKNSPMTFDVDNCNVWYPLYSEEMNFKTYYGFPSSLSIGAPTYTTYQSIKILYEDIVLRIQTCRFQLSSTTATLWTRDRSLQTYLEEGMELISSIDDLDPLCKEAKEKKKLFYEWRLALLSLTPNHHRLRWIYSTFNHIDPELIVNHLWNSVSFLKDTDSSRLYTKIMPFDSILTYVALVAVTKLRRLQQRQLTYVSKMYKK